MNVKLVLSPLVITNANVQGALLSLGDFTGYAIQAVWPAGLVGTLNLRYSIDGITYSDDASTLQTVNGANSFIWSVNNGFYDQVSLFFTYTSGSGTITATGQKKS